MYTAHPKERYYNKKVDGKWGMYAKRDIGNGELVGVLRGIVVPKRTKTSIEYEGVIYEPTNGMGCMNHSCEPNAVFTILGLMANRDIMKDEEITFDYHSTESNIKSPFICECGASNCKGLIK